MNLREKLGIQDFDNMVASTLQSIVDSGVGITNTAPGSVIRTIVEAILDNVDIINYYAEYIYDALSIDNATGEDLDRLVSILGINRKKSTQATGIVTFSTGDAPYEYDIRIPYGYEISTRQDSNGAVYIYTVNEEDVVLVAGQTSIDVEVISEDYGHKYLPAGALSVMTKSIIGIASVINKNEINSGYDQETDNELRRRTKEYIKAFGKCTDTALKMAIEDIDGIINCTIVDQYQGVGTSGAIVVPEILPPLDNVMANVESVIADTKASGIKVIIVYPTIKYINISITITDSVSDNLILEAISNYVNSLKVGQIFMIRQMERKILNAIDDNNIENDDIDIITTIPSENITCNTEEIIRVQSITVNGVKHNV